MIYGAVVPCTKSKMVQMQGLIRISVIRSCETTIEKPWRGKKVLALQVCRSRRPANLVSKCLHRDHCSYLSSAVARRTKEIESSGGQGEKAKWKWIPWSLGIACLAVLQLIRTLRRESTVEESTVEDPVTWQLTMFRLLPARLLSRAWGSLARIELLSWSRRPLLGFYVWAFDCHMEEALVENLRSYRSLLELFTRRLKPRVRPISSLHELVSPSDGKVLHFGKVDSDGRLEQVKGVTYDLERFLGARLQDVTRDILLKVKSHSGQDDGHVCEDQNCYRVRSVSDTKSLYHVVLYLAPGDYHHFHSPVDWNIAIRRHFPGELLTVAPWAAKTMPGLFTLNERVVLSGQWRYGFFSFAAVGAYNVGSICIEVDKTLQTNVKGQYQIGEFFERQLGDVHSGLVMKKGDRIGHFSLGSSIVLVFEAPDNFEFEVEVGQTVKYGQSLGTVCNKKS